MTDGPTPGAVGGAAGELGSLQRAGVLAFVAAHILRGRPLRDLGLPAERSIPLSMAAETGSAVDDVEVFCEGGGHAYLQVKTRLTAATRDECVEQWAELAATIRLDPSCTRVLACGGTAVGDVLELRGALDRYQQSSAGAPTKAESEALTGVREKLADVPEDRRDRLLSCAGVWIAEFRAENEVVQKLGAEMLDGHVVESGQGLTAWLLLREHSRVLAARRGGAELDDLLAFLRTTEVTLVDDAAASRAAARVAEHNAEADYRAAVVTAGREVSLDGVGAGIPPIPLDELDMSVNAAPGPPREDREAGSGHELPWLVRSRGRVLLCGPPGSGKSVALRATAAHYADLPDWPMPILVDLPRWQERRGALGDQTALLEVAFELEPSFRRRTLMDAAERALETGRAVVLFDSLDETGRARRSVVEALRGVLSRVHPDVEVVLSTRDVGYADGRALSFSDLSLFPPGQPLVTVRALLEAVAVRDDVPLVGREAWVTQRVDWVSAHLDADRTLRRTPLMVVLLTLLAATRSPDQLPHSRAEVLAQVIRDVVRRWEHETRLKGGEFALGQLRDVVAHSAAEKAFNVIGHHVLRGDDPTADVVVGALAGSFAAEFDLVPGQAGAAADAAVDLWDIAGVFVKEGGEERLRARIQSLAELAEAIYATSGTDDLTSWVRWAVADDSGREPLQLAAGLHQPAADALLAVSGEVLEWPRLKQVIGALRAGSRPTDAAIDTLIAQLQAVIEREADDAERWGAAVTLTALPVPVDRREDVLSALDSLAEHESIVARALAVEGWDREDEAVEADLRRLIATNLGHVPVLEEAQHAWFGLGPDPHEAAAYATALDRLLAPGDDDFAREVLRTMDRRLAAGAAWRVRDMLVARGFADLVEAHDRESAIDAMPDMPVRHRAAPAIDELLTMHAEAERTIEDALLERVEPAALSWRQLRRVDEAADLRETLDLGRQRPGSLLEDLRDDPEGFGYVADALAKLTTVDMPVATAQIAELRQIAEANGRTAVFALTSAGRRTGLVTDWERVANAAATAVGLVDVIARGGEWLTVTAAHLVSGVSPALRPGVLDRLACRRASAQGYPLELLTMVWLILEPTDEARAATANDSRPPVRRALVTFAAGSPDPAGVLAALVGDDDALVQDMAVRAASRHGLLDALAGRLAEMGPPTGWECRWCTTHNPSGNSSCSRCRTVRSPSSPESSDATDEY